MLRHAGIRLTLCHDLAFLIDLVPVEIDICILLQEAVELLDLFVVLVPARFLTVFFELSQIFAVNQ